MTIRPKFDWADNKLKLDRAVSVEGQEATEFQIQQQYIKLGGRVIGEPLKELATFKKVKVNDPIAQTSTMVSKVEAKASPKAPSVKRSPRSRPRASR